MNQKDLIEFVSTWSLASGTWIAVTVGVYCLVFGLLLPQIEARYGEPIWPRGTLEPLYGIFVDINTAFGLALNSFLSYSLVKEIFSLKYSWTCQPISMPDDKRVAVLIWWYVLVKFFEWTDSILLMRRMQRLGKGWYIHVFHHGLMVIFAWCGLVFYPAGTTAIGILLNCLTHTCDYALGFARNLGLELDERRIYLNRIRKIQFVLGGFACLSAAIVNCGVPILLLFPPGVFCVCLLFANIWYTGIIY